MTEIKTLKGAALDWAVAVAARKSDVTVHGPTRHTDTGFVTVRHHPDAIGVRYSPSTDWADAGGIIDRTGISMHCNWQGEPSTLPIGGFCWYAVAFQDRLDPQFGMDGDTALEAAMRCFVAYTFSRLEVDVPEALRPEALRPEALRPEALRPEALRPEALRRGKFSQPSLLQPLHHLDGVRCLVYVTDAPSLRVYFTDGPVRSMQVPRETLIWE